MKCSSQNPRRWESVKSSPRLQPSSRITRCQSALDRESTPDGLVVLPIFTGSSVLLPTSRGILRAFEPRYLQMFNHLRAASPAGDGKGARFMHILSPKIAPPAMLEKSPSSIGNLPGIGCCAIIESVQTAPDESIIVEYSGHRRVLLHLVQNGSSNVEFDSDGNNINNNEDVKINGDILHAAGEWYDDIEPEILDPISGTVSSIYAAERDVAGIVQQIARLSKIVDPENSKLPDALVRYAPPSSGAQQTRPTSYDALKAAKHPAATSIEMWRRHGSVYNSQSAPREAHADPYTQVSERLGRLRRQEMYSFAASQLLQLGIPEAAALLLSRDTAGRLQFVLEAARPYLAQLSAEAALNRALE